MRTLRLVIGQHRTTLAVGLLLAAIWFTIRAAGPEPPATVTVLVAAHDLAAGHQLTEADLRRVRWPVDLAPDQGRADTGPGATVEPGGVLAGPVREGEAITEGRVLGPGLLQGLPVGTAAVPVRLTDPAGAALVQAGERVDVLASTASTWSAEEGGGSSTLSPATTRRAARNALVLSASAPRAETGAWEEDVGKAGGGWEGGSDDAAALAGVLVLAVRESEVAQLVGAVTGAQVSVVVLAHPQAGAVTGAASTR